MIKKKIVLFICLMSFCAQTAFASVIGEPVYSWTHQIATGAEVHKNVFMSDNASVGQQVEYVAEYTPNTDVVPAVINGNSIFGLRNIEKAEEYMREQGMMPLLGINASYFSLQTGIPMGHVLSDGKILSKDGASYDSIGFLENGKAFIAPLAIKTTLSFDKEEVDIEHINKYPQELVDIITLFNSDYGEETYNDCESLTLILGDVSDALAIGKTITATVEEKFISRGSLAIPKDKILININTNGKPELYEAVNSLEIGDLVKISNESDSDARWEKVVSGLGSVGERLVKDGEVQSGFSIGASPRTAVGITEDGKVIFYVIDGRQKPYSYGVQLKSLAGRMAELGCLDAINLDGGGSTAISGIYPGTENSIILNSPSDGKLRACSNYIFLKNLRKPSDIPNKMFLYPFGQHYLSGYSEKLTVTAVDTNFYKIPTPEMLSFDVTGESVIEDWVLTAKGDGKHTVSVTDGKINGMLDFNVYDTPTEINVYDAVTGTEIKEIKAKTDETIIFRLKAKYNNIELKSNNDCFEIEVDENIGKITPDGIVITAKAGEGEIRISAGDYTRRIPVSIYRENPFFDTDEHWAKDMIKAVYEKKIISGYEDEIGLCFAPENNITREEFAVIMCKYLGLDAETNEGTEKFADKDNISVWAMPYVSAVVKESLINGKADGEKLNFAPKDYLTRAEAMTILGRTLDIIDSEIDFDDAEDIPEWAMDYVSTMVSNGYVNGYNNTISPNKNITRAEIVTIIYKMLD